MYAVRCQNPAKQSRIRATIAAAEREGRVKAEERAGCRQQSQAHDRPTAAHEPAGSGPGTQGPPLIQKHYHHRGEAVPDRSPSPAPATEHASPVGPGDRDPSAAAHDPADNASPDRQQQDRCTPEPDGPSRGH